MSAAKRRPTALAERDSLLRQRRSAVEQRDRAGQTVREQERVATQAQHDRDSALVLRARGDVTAEDAARDAAERHLAAEATRNDAHAAGEAAAQALLQVEDELARLYRDRFPEFAAEAEKSTAAAAEAIAAALPLVREAHGAWARAQGSWRPLAPAVREAYVRAQAELGYHVGDDDRRVVGSVPDFPWPTQFDYLERAARGELAARPLGLRPSGEVDVDEPA